MNTDRKIALFSLLLPLPFHQPEPADSLQPQTPRYELQLSLAELSFFQNTAARGVHQYGGETRYEVHFYPYQGDVYAQVTLESKRSLEDAVYLVNEHLAESIELVDLDDIDPVQRFALQTGRQVRSKLARAKDEPRYDSRSLRGTFVGGEQGAALAVGTELLRVEGDAAEHAGLFAGLEVQVEGTIREAGVVTVESIRRVERDTLDLFVMSLCPFGMQATKLVAEGLSLLPADALPTVRVHYILYETGAEGEERVLSTLHGEPELEEDLVQIVLQEQYPTALFFRYLAARADSGLGWRDVARGVGLTEDDLEVVAYRVENERDDLLRGEFETVTGTFGIHDGSPTYLWEGREASPAEIPFLAGLEAAGPPEGSCAATQP